LRNSFHYAAVHLQSIADTARDVDQAMRWGFGMKQGPFELWQEAGWLEVAQMVQEDIDAGKALCKRRCPTGCSRPGGRGRRRAHRQGFVEPGTGQFVPRRTLPVYSASSFPSCCWAKAGRALLAPARPCSRTRRCAPGRWTARC
jgi:3-hydroxyacyl-CoA dehydrogenase